MHANIRSSGSLKGPYVKYRPGLNAAEEDAKAAKAAAAKKKKSKK
jgi:hypothetical protein